jgi:hypothetical protein
MSKDNFEEIKKTILEINEIVSKVDPIIKQSVFNILVGRFISGDKMNDGVRVEDNSKGKDEVKDVNTDDLGVFISPLDTKKPADALMAMVAWLYSQYGAYVMSIKELRELGDSCGLTLPARIDMTLRQAKSNGKNQFIQHGKAWKLTVAGELAIKETYNVTKGTKSLPEEQA